MKPGNDDRPGTWTLAGEPWIGDNPAEICRGDDDDDNDNDGDDDDDDDDDDDGGGDNDDDDADD